MEEKKQLNNKWLKASVLGCLWASSEIVLGSFLHNLKIPFAGNILTGIGIVLFISVSYIWKEKGLFWRAGIVCALMKSISPSAIIIGPMTAIISEALLMELSVRIFRRNIFSFLLAGMLAMSWNLFYIIANYLIIYGANIIDIYIYLAKYTQLRLNINNDNHFIPIILFLLLFILQGLAVAILGIYIGKKASKQKPLIGSLSVNQVLEIKSEKTDTSFSFSLNWLLFNIILLVGELALISFTKWIYWFVIGLFLLIIWSLRYKKSLMRLAKPKFWICFVIITVLSGFVLYAIKNSGNDLITGFIVGLEMNFRAAVVIVGFSTLGTELRNPRIKNLFTKSYFTQLTLALEVAFDTLPLVIANLPQLKDIFKHPVKIFHQLVSQADIWLEKVELKINKRKNVIIIKGSEKTGKSTFLKNIVEKLKMNNIKIGGFVSPSVFENNVNIGYNLINILSSEEFILSRTHGEEQMPKVGGYYFYKDAINAGKLALDVDNIKDVDIIVVDEVGPWELKSQGWASSLNNLVRQSKKTMIWVVRESIVDKVIENWSLSEPLIVDSKNNNYEETTTQILKIAYNTF